jgi:hypothetical protein
MVGEALRAPDWAGLLPGPEGLTAGSENLLTGLWAKIL